MEATTAPTHTGVVGPLVATLGTLDTSMGATPSTRAMATRVSFCVCLWIPVPAAL